MQVAVVQTTALDRIIPGEMYTHRIYSPVIKCSFIRSYQCAEVGVFTHFYDTTAFNDLTPVNLMIPDDMKYTYLPIVPSDYFSRKKIEQDEDEKLDLDDLDWDSDTPISDDEEEEEEEEEEPEENLNQNEEESDTINEDNQNNSETKEEDLEDLISEIFKKEKGDKK